MNLLEAFRIANLHAQLQKAYILSVLLNRHLITLELISEVAQRNCDNLVKIMNQNPSRAVELVSEDLTEGEVIEIMNRLECPELLDALIRHSKPDASELTPIAIEAMSYLENFDVLLDYALISDKLYEAAVSKGVCNHKIITSGIVTENVLELAARNLSETDLSKLLMFGRFTSNHYVPGRFASSRDARGHFIPSRDARGRFIPSRDARGRSSCAVASSRNSKLQMIADLDFMSCDPSDLEGMNSMQLAELIKYNLSAMPWRLPVTWILGASLPVTAFLVISKLGV